MSLQFPKNPPKNINFNIIPFHKARFSIKTQGGVICISYTANNYSGRKTIVTASLISLRRAKPITIAMYLKKWSSDKKQSHPTSVPTLQPISIVSIERTIMIKMGQRNVNLNFSLKNSTLGRSTAIICRNYPKRDCRFQM